MPITRQDFERAEGGDLFIDAHGQEWHILKRLSHGLMPGVSVRRGDWTDRLYWQDNQILDIDHKCVNELIRQEAKFVPA